MFLKVAIIDINAGNLAVLHAPTRLKPFRSLHTKRNFSAKGASGKSLLIRP